MQSTQSSPMRCGKQIVSWETFGVVVLLFNGFNGLLEMTSPSFGAFLRVEKWSRLKPSLPLFTTIWAKVRRFAVLKHFSDEAEKLEEFPLHILSDIDQTVVIGTFGAGVLFCVWEQLQGFADVLLLDNNSCVTVRKM